MVRLIERGTNQIVHGRVRDDELLLAVLLGIEHTRYQCARLPDEETAGLDEQMDINLAQYSFE